MLYDILIVGGGCAGISAAIYAASRGKKTLLIEQEAKPGGEIRRISTITHFVGAFDGENGAALAGRMEEQLRFYDVDIVQGAVTCADLDAAEKLVKTGSGEYRARSVIIAAGTTQKDLDGVSGAAPLAHAISHCAHRDAAQYAGKHVFVVGGSDGAAKEALFLSATAKQVTMVVLEPKLAAISQFSQQIAAAPNIEVLTGSSLKALHGAEHLASVEIVNNTSHETASFEAAGGGIFVYIGAAPNTAWCKGVQLDGDGYILTDDTMRTNLPDVYAAGDIRAKTVRQIATAVSDGTIAAIQAAASLQ